MGSPFEGNLLITGGAGFLGRGILRYIDQNNVNARVTVYSRDEAKHYAMRQKFPDVRCVLGDIRDTERLAAVMSGHDTVIHAAALKHIPEAERDVTEAVAVNVEGSRSVGWAALRAGVGQVVGISTDKVCSPRNAYGATKMLMERMFQELNRLGSTRFSCVRYGNVISSTGSVVPLFRDQLSRTNRISLTDSRMTRFWFGAEDAVRLIECALASEYAGGGVYAAACPAMTLPKVAMAVVDYLGYKGVEIDTIGLRPGEKLHETLIDENERPFTTEMMEHTALGKIFHIPASLDMKGVLTGDDTAYSSHNPDYWLTREQFIEQIQLAEKI